MPDFSSRRRPRPRASRLDVLLLAAAAVAAAGSAYVAAGARAQLGQAQSALIETHGAAERMASRMRSLEAQTRGVDQTLMNRAVLAAEAPPPRVVSDVAGLLPAGVRLRSLTLAYGPRLELELRVAARRGQDYDVFLDRLSASPLFTSVVPGPEERAAEITATVQAVYRRERQP